MSTHGKACANCHDVAVDKRLTIAIWDLDCTQGQYWSNEGSDYHSYNVGPERNFYGEQLSLHSVFKKLKNTDPSFHGLATERYWQLRETTFSPDKADVEKNGTIDINDLTSLIDLVLSMSDTAEEA